MPDPRTLKAGDKIRFTGVPDEWADPECHVPGESRRFMRHMLMRGFPSRVCRVDEYGWPWIAARLTIDGKIEHHTWAIREKTGWRKVKKRT
jgi:rubredoxin